MKKLRNLLLLMLALLLALGLFSCKKDDENAGETETETPAVVTEINFFDYAVVRADDVPADLEAGIADMYAKLVALSGNENVYTSDAAAEPSAKEILVGHTNRPETEQVLSQLAAGEYAVAVVGNKVVITGQTENITDKAVAYFVDTYLKEGANGILGVNLFYKETADVAVLIDKGDSVYTLVRRKNPYTGEMAIVNELSDAIRNKTGASIDLKTDNLYAGTTHDADALEILLGYVNYDETAELKKKVNPDSYAIEFVGKKIVIYAWTIEGLQDAADAFEDMLTYGCYTNADGDSTLTVLKNSASGKSADFYSDVPIESNGVFCTRAWNVHNNSMLLYWDEADEDMFTNYTSAIEAMGFTKNQSLDNSSILSATYVKDSDSVHVYYLKRLGELRVVTQKNAVIPVNTTEVEDICKPSVTQIGVHTDDSDYMGMSYLIRLNDGSYVVIDGGRDREDNADELYNQMVKQKKTTDEKIKIAAWIITNANAEHVGGYTAFANKYKNNVTVDYLLGNELSDLELENIKVARSVDFGALAAKHDGCKYVKVHTGQQFTFAGTTFTVMYTHEDLIQNEVNRNYNDNASTVIKADIDDMKFLWLSDVEDMSGERIYSMYNKSDLKCDILQVGNHGMGGQLDLYKACDPDIAFWPVGEKAVVDGLVNNPQNEWLTKDTLLHYYNYLGSHVISFDKLPDTGDVVGGVDGDADYSKPY